jgi:hypothetical protein
LCCSATKGIHGASDPPRHARAETPDPRPAHDAREAQVALHRRGQRREIGLGHGRRGREAREPVAAQPLVFGAQAEGAPREGAVHRRDDGDDVRDRAEPRVAPRRDDRDLRGDGAGGRGEPEPARRDEEGGGRGEEERGGPQPQRAHRARDRDRELGEGRVPEGLHEAHDVDQPVNGEHDGERDAHGDLQTGKKSRFLRERSAPAGPRARFEPREPAAEHGLELGHLAGGYRTYPCDRKGGPGAPRR